MFDRILMAAAMTAALGAASPSIAQDVPTDPAKVWSYLNSLAPTERMDVIEREARREGKLVIYAAMGTDRARVFLDMFEKRYPGIDVEFNRMSTSELPQKLMLEYRTGRSTADVAMTSSEWLGVLSEALGPYVPTSWNDLHPKFRHGGIEQGWAAADHDSLIEVIGWRTDRVSADEAPKSLDELSDPKWHGRVGTTRAREQFVDAYIARYGRDEAMAKIDRLAALDNRIFPSIAGLAEALGAGEIDVAWGVSGTRVARLKAAGAPVDFVLQSPAMTLNETIAVTRLASHPYAAALLMEFLLDPATMEASDKIEPGRLFGNTKGTYTIPATVFEDLTIYRSIPQDEFRDLNRIVEQKFIRR